MSTERSRADRLAEQSAARDARTEGQRAERERRNQERDAKMERNRLALEQRRQRGIGPTRVEIFTGILVALLVLTVSFTISSFLVGFAFARFGVAAPGWVQQLAGSFLGLALMVITLGTVGYLTRGRQRSAQTVFFRPIADALARLAEGDFSVHIDDTHLNAHIDDPVGILVKGVNTLAQELNQMEALRQEFISNVSHEIQSPLTSIRGFARALNNEQLTPAERAHYLNIIELESTRLSNLTENLLALASLDAEAHTLTPKPYRLDSQIRQLVLASEPQWKDKQIEMEVAAEPLTITADQDLLSQVWTNLIHNACKFTPEHGKIFITLQPQDDRVEFQIRDTGIGISAQDQEHIFERFFKADTARERSKGGSGLGLAIAKKIVEMHHGTIRVESAGGKGTTFHVTLPLMQGGV